MKTLANRIKLIVNVLSGKYVFIDNTKELIIYNGKSGQNLKSAATAFFKHVYSLE